jgi:hypothetical protein
LVIFFIKKVLTNDAKCDIIKGWIFAARQPRLTAESLTAPLYGIFDFEHKENHMNENYPEILR